MYYHPWLRLKLACCGPIWEDHMDDLKLKFYPKLDEWQLNYFWGKPFEAPGGDQGMQKKNLIVELGNTYTYYFNKTD